jgi:hypothetical protein
MYNDNHTPSLPVTVLLLIGGMGFIAVNEEKTSVAICLSSAIALGNKLINRGRAGFPVAAE